ncbi:MAG: hydroxymethylglutaryl-CoA lyase [Coxiellaceae bacterium]|nr:hydroxymethylglutaryl-CoA lyase [Coxiellaceae bacterium]
MPLPKKVIITEVSPRDGLQNESTFISTEDKIKFINLLTEAHFPIIEATSFVNPKKIPALADHDAIMTHFPNTENTHYSAVIPNVQGLQNAIAAGCKHIAVLTAVSETFLQKNIHCTISESLARIQDIITIAKQQAISVRAYISCTMGCPYEGFIAIKNTVEIAEKLLHMGCDEIAISDTIGTGTPHLAKNIIEAVLQKIPLEKIAIHFHDTYGQALANIYACLELGVTKIDASIGGLGGCPYAKGASGNVATEEVLYLLNGLHIETGIDLQKAIRASRFIYEKLGRETRSKVVAAEA